jgi:hypothetical protein
MANDDVQYYKFKCAKVVWVELPGVGRAAAGVAALAGCSSFTRRDLVQLDDESREQELLDKLKEKLREELDKELAELARKSADKP